MQLKLTILITTSLLWLSSCNIEMADPADSALPPTSQEKPIDSISPTPPQGDNDTNSGDSNLPNNSNDSDNSTGMEPIPEQPQPVPPKDTDKSDDTKPIEESPESGNEPEAPLQPPEQPPEQPELDEPALSGETLYLAQCANCHGTTGDGLPKGSSILPALKNVASAKFSIQTTMPIQNPNQCDDACADAIVNWLVQVNNLAANDSTNDATGDNSSDTDHQDTAPKSALSQISLEPASKTYRRASLILTGAIPEQTELDRLEFASDDELRTALLKLMQGDGFKAFIKRGANDQLHVRGGNSFDIYNALKNYYTNLGDLIKQRDEQDLVDYNWSVREEPLELIAHVVLNDKPYGEILTADYTLVNDATTQLYNSGVTTNGQWRVGKNKNQSVRSETRSLKDADREIEIAHAGILSTIGFNARWQSTATNRNRARAKYVLLHFLGYDIEATASRDFPDEALEDTDNPTMNNPTCVQCHKVLDPIAGAFQNVGDVGMYFDRRGSDGLDSLDATYVKNSEHYSMADRWYGDMRLPGFYDAILPDQDNSLPWLAKQIVADARFSEATVKFWWPALFGEDFFHDKLTDAQRTERLATLKQLTNAFGSEQSLKALLVEMLMSPWYRAERKDSSLADSEIVYYSGGQRLLTPEELSQKATSLTGTEINAYEKEFSAYFGGIDSASALIRSREITSLMNKVLERVSYENACKVVASEFNLTADKRKLFKAVAANSMVGIQYLAEQTLTSQATQTSTNNDRLRAAFTAKGRDVMLNINTQGKPLYLGLVIVRDTQGTKIIEAFGQDFIEQYGANTDHATSINKLSDTNKAGYLRTSQVQTFKLALPAGDYEIDMISWRKEANVNFSITLTHEITADDPAFFSSVENPEISQQMQFLIQRLHGRYVPIDSLEIKQLMQIFASARMAKVERGSHNDMVESGVYCTYSDPEKRRESEWGKDSDDTLHAWKVVIAALMSSFDFAYE